MSSFEVSARGAGFSNCDELAALGATVDATIRVLSSFLQTHDFAGYDPYDGLNSRFFQATPFRQSRLVRLAFIQFNKRSPVNFRGVLGVARGRNPKGVALCASAFLKLYSLADRSRSFASARDLLSWLDEHHVSGFEGLSWGYNFDWQSRTFFAPRGTPNAVCTIFAANAFLDAFEALENAAYLDKARACCEFLLGHLLTPKKNEVHFRYLPAQDTEIHNVNLLAAALLARVGSCTGEDRLTGIARQAAMFSIQRQRPDGSWPYGEASKQRWIDNYHTGFNLVALSKYRSYSGDDSFADATRRGYEFWDRNFLRADGAPRYYPNREYPIDIHCVAQAMLTYLEFALVDENAASKIARILRWALDHLWSPAGYFYYQRHRFYTIRTAYMRWSQAWMLYALSSVSEALLLGAGH